MVDMTRRMLLGGMMLLALAAAAAPARADGGDGDNGRDGGGDNGGDDGGDNDGPGGGDDDGDDDSDGDGGGNSGPGSGKTKVEDQYRAEKAVKNGKAVSLQKLKTYLDRKYPGKLLSVAIARRQGNYIYRLRILSTNNRIQAVTLNALTLEAVVY
jgi:hypothetical protein